MGASIEIFRECHLEAEKQLLSMTDEERAMYSAGTEKMFIDLGVKPTINPITGETSWPSSAIATALGWGEDELREKMQVVMDWHSERGDT